MLLVEIGEGVLCLFVDFHIRDDSASCWLARGHSPGTILVLTGTIEQKKKS